MKHLERWFEQRHSQLERSPSLDEALLGGGGVHYAWYRLRYVLVRALMRSAFRLAEVTLFASAFSMQVLGPVLLFRSLTLLLGGLFWGGLETLRRDVRELSREGKWPQAARRVEQWLGAAVLLALLVQVGCVAWVLWGPSPFASFSVVDAYVLACGLRLGSDLVARTYHSGVYALRRVYRPIWSLFAVDLADILLLFGLWWALGPWSLGVSLACVGMMRATLAWHFTHQSYRGLRLRVGPPVAWLRSLRRGHWALRHSLVSAFGNCVAQMDAMVVMALLWAPLGDAEGRVLLGSLLHVVAPLLASSVSWSRLFYFDFKRLEGWGSELLLERFEGFLGRVAWLVPLPISALIAVIVAAFWKGPTATTLPWLCAWTGVRAWVSLNHVRAFSLGDKRYLLRLALLMVGVLGFVPFLRPRPDAALSALVAAYALGLALLGPSRRSAGLVARGSALLGLSEWAARVAHQNAPGRVSLVRVDRKLLSLGRLARALGGVVVGAPMARLSPDTLVWFESAPDTERSRLLGAGAGAIRTLERGPVAPSGRDALAGGLQDRSWRRLFDGIADPTASPASALAELRAQLAARAPGHRWLDLENPRRIRATFRGLAPPLRRMFLDALRGHSGFRREGEGEFALLAPAGRPRALVYVPTSRPERGATQRAASAEPSTAAKPDREHWRPPITAALRRAELQIALDEHG